MQAVGSRGQAECDRALAKPILRVERGSAHAELVHRFVRRIDVGLVALELHERYRHAVELHFVLERNPAIDGVLGCISLYPGRQVTERIDLPSQPADLNGRHVHQFRFQRGSDFRRGRIERNAGRLYVHRFRCRARGSAKL